MGIDATGAAKQVKKETQQHLIKLAILYVETVNGLGDYHIGLEKLMPPDRECDASQVIGHACVVAQFLRTTMIEHAYELARIGNFDLDDAHAQYQKARADRGADNA